MSPTIDSPAWTARVGGSAADQLNAVALDSTGALVVAGSASSAVDGQTSAGGLEGLVTKYSASGAKQWTRLVGTSQADSANAVAIGSADSVYVAGYLRAALDGQPNLGGPDLWVSRYDAAGTRLWTRTAGSTANDVASAVATQGGGVFVAGYTGKSLSGSAAVGRNDVAVVRYDEAGTQSWAVSFGTSQDDAAAGIAIDATGSAYVVGTTSGAFAGNTAAGGKDLFLSRLSTSGAVLWTRQFGTAADDSATGVALGADGSIYVSAITAGALGGPLAGSTDAALLKLDSNGVLVWTKQLGGAAVDEGLAVAADTDAVYLAGRSLGQLPGANAGGALNLFAARFAFHGTLQTVREYSGGNASGNTLAAAVAAANGRLILAGATTATTFDGVAGFGNTDGLLLSLCSGHGLACELAGSCTTNHGSCTASQSCVPDGAGFVQCTCGSGYTGSVACSDVNECLTSNGGCDSLTTCANTVGSRTCGACPAGYTGTGATGCVDVNECATNNGGCDPYAACLNTPGSVSCGACLPGFTGMNATGCLDVDECLTNNGGCDLLTACSNIPGGVTCGACPSGYAGTGATGCFDINECATNNGGCGLASCVNSVGGFSCAACEDPAICSTNNGGCRASALCAYNGCQHSCACPSGTADNGTECVPLGPAWTARPGTTGTDQLNGVARDSAGNVFVTGFVAAALDGQLSGGGQDAFVTKYTAAGVKSWTRLAGTSLADAANAIAVDPGDALYVGGYMRAAIDGQVFAGGVDGWVAKYDGAGNRLWSRLPGTTSTDTINAVAADTTGVVAAGVTGLNLPGSVRGGKNDVLLAKYDSAGAVLWAKSFGTAQDDSAAGIALDSSGNVYVVGTTAAALNGGTALGGKDLFIAKLSATGTFLWTRQLGTPSDDTGTGVAVGSDGAIYVAGFTSGTFGGALAGSTDAVLVKLDANGSVLWTQQLGGAAVDEAIGVSTDARFVYLVGRSLGQLPGSSAGGLLNLFAAKYAFDGTRQTVREYSGGNSSGTTFGAALAVGGGRLLLAGASSATSFDGVSGPGGTDGLLLSVCTGPRFACDLPGSCAVNRGGCTASQTCSADGTGYVQCSCNDGYTGSTTCTDVNECVVSNGGCDALTSCTNITGGRVCGSCPSGYSGIGATGCIDINECSTNNGGCDALTSCSNTPGSRTCGACPSGYSGTGATGCVDVNECSSSNGGCDVLTSCTNTPGSRTCGSCPSGYSGNGATGCADVNECATDNGLCDLLTTCTNTIGGSQCGLCPAGYDGTGLTGCADINECALDNGGCDPLTTCLNLPGTRGCGLCPAGFSGTGETGCVDVNECLANNGDCGPGSCANTIGSHTCTCPSGYSGTGTESCTEVDECLTNNGGCDLLTTCTNTPGSRTCGTCPSGYTGNGASPCVDVNECLTNNGGCDARTTCTNTVGARTCSACPAGFSGTGDTTCVDINECLISNGGCDLLTTCTNTVGARTCGACPAGYTGTGATGCVDVNECISTSPPSCTSNSKCANTPGSSQCTCIGGYANSSGSCVDVNECSAGTATCDAVATCQNATGAWNCSCPTGYTGAAGPAARFSAASYWDPTLQKMVLFGGMATSVTSLGDLWTFDGRVWTALSAPGPSARGQAAYAYDDVRHRFVLFGGTTGTNFLGDTWEFDGVTWTQVTPAHSPGARSRSGATYDAANGRFLLFGGTGTAGIKNDVWSWDGTDWTQVATVTGTTNAPAAVNEPAMAYDPARRIVVIYGGTNGQGTATTNGVVLNGDRWEVLSVAPLYVDTRGDGARFVYDSERGSLIIFVKKINTFQSDTFAAYDFLSPGTGWRSIATTTQSSTNVRAFGSPIFFPSLHMSYIFGGKTASNVANASLLGFSGSAWGGIFTPPAGTCQDIDECLTSNGGCGPGTCNNTSGSHTCTCPSGYSGTGTGVCTDINECLTGNGGCDARTTCTNTVGSRTCGACPAGFTGDGYTGCVDINECLTNNGGCDPGTCNNTPGSRTCSCPTGYTGTTSCTDINECATGNGGCDALTTCTNTPGSRSCGACPAGYTGTGATGCADINECVAAPCDLHASCANSPGSFGCTCDASTGYQGNGLTCVYNPCLLSNGGCDVLASCTNDAGVASCGACPSGYSGTGAIGCFDVDECATSNGGCDPVTTCTNTIGSRTCGACPTHYTGNGATGCTPTNYCLTNNGGCDPITQCSPIFGSTVCGDCPVGYTGNGATGCVAIGGGLSTAVSYQIDAAHTGNQVDPAIRFPLTRLWSTTLGSSISAPLIAEGRVFLTYTDSLASTGAIVALDRTTGQPVWGPVPLGYQFQRASPSYENGKLFVMTTEGWLWAFVASTGEVLWSALIPGQTSFTHDPVASGGLVYAYGAGSGSILSALSQTDGSVVWSASGSTTVGPNLGVLDGALFANSGCRTARFDGLTGSLAWVTGASSCPFGAAPVLASGRVYQRNTSGTSSILDPANGALLSTYAGTSTAAVNGARAYALSSSTLRSYDGASGATQWTFAGDSHLVTVPIVVNGTVMAGSSSGNLYAVDGTTGQQVWSDNLGSAMSAPDEYTGNSPMKGIGAGGGQVIAATSTKVFAYGWTFPTDGGSPDAGSPDAGSADGGFPDAGPAATYVMGNYQVDPGHAGAQGDPALQLPLKRLWSSERTDQIGYPVIANGHVYLTTMNGTASTLTALNGADGAFLWNRTLNGRSSSASYENGRFFTAGNGTAQAYSEDTGAPVWSVTLPGGTSLGTSTTAANGLVYVGDGSKKYALSQTDGHVVWQISSSNGTMAPTILDGGLYAVGDCGGFGVNALTGAALWSFTPSPGCSGSGAYISGAFGGAVYARNTMRGNVVLNAMTGAILGSFNGYRLPAFRGSEAYSLNGSVLAAYDREHWKMLWRFTGDGLLVTNPLVVNDVVYIGSSGGKLYALDRFTGNVLWSDTTGTAFVSQNEFNPAPLTGLGAANGLLVAPAGSKVFVYAAGP